MFEKHTSLQFHLNEARRIIRQFGQAESYDSYRGCMRDFWIEVAWLQGFISAAWSADEADLARRLQTLHIRLGNRMAVRADQTLDRILPGS